MSQRYVPKGQKILEIHWNPQNLQNWIPKAQVWGTDIIQKTQKCTVQPDIKLELQNWKTEPEQQLEKKAVLGAPITKFTIFMCLLKGTHILRFRSCLQLYWE